MLSAEATRMAATWATNRLDASNKQFEQANICANLSEWALNCAAHNLLNSTTNNIIQGKHQNEENYMANHHNYNEQQQQQQSLGAFHLSANGHSKPLAWMPLTSLVTNHLLTPTRQLERAADYYLSDIWLESGDERSNKLPFIGAGPWKLIGATLIYLLLIKWLLPKLMKHLPGFELNWPIRLYNFLMVLSNLWAFYHGARLLNFGLKCFGCETINHRDYSPNAIELLHYGWLFLMSRLIEWLDTIFFVLRKRERQVTKLHVFHHSFVPLLCWTYLKLHPGYTVAFFPFVNSFVHSIMYTYYLLATFGPKVQAYLWWKRYLTSLQIAQFVLILIQLASIPLTGDETCQYPRGFLYVAFAGALLFLWLFFTYYLDTYTKARQQKGAATANAKQQLSSNNNNTSALRFRRASEREGTSRSLSDVVDSAIGCGIDQLKSQMLEDDKMARIKIR